MVPLDRKERVKNRQWHERASGKKVRPGLGRPKRKKSHDEDDRTSHRARPELREKSALHVTVRTTARVPNLRSRKRYAAIRNAFVKFCVQETIGFRLVHFAVLSNHLHFVVEADSKRALSMGMQKVLHSISRRLNALCVREQGGRQIASGAASSDKGGYRALSGWIGRVFSDRYFAHHLKTRAEMENAVRYVRDNAKKHYGAEATGLLRQGRGLLDSFSSFVAAENMQFTTGPTGFLLKRICTLLSSA
jgi:REP element-mobilizing transposase RayT